MLRCTEMTLKGDFYREWNPTNAEEVETARRWFNEMKAKGYLMFRTNAAGRSEHVRDFDPNDQELLFHTTEIVATPRPVGG